MAAEIRRVAEKGCHAVSFSENPHRSDCRASTTDALGPVLAGVQRRRHGRLPPHRRRRRASCPATPFPIDVPITLHADHSRPLRRRPAVVADLAEVPRAARSRCPRAASAGSRTSSRRPTSSTTTTARGPAPTSATSSRARCSASTCRRASSTTPPGANPPPHRRRPHHVGGDYPHSDSTWPDAPERCGRARRAPRRRHRPDHARNAMRASASTRSRTAEEECTVGRCARRRPDVDIEIKEHGSAQGGSRRRHALGVARGRCREGRARRRRLSPDRIRARSHRATPHPRVPCRDRRRVRRADGARRRALRACVCGRRCACAPRVDAHFVDRRLGRHRVPRRPHGDGRVRVRNPLREGRVHSLPVRLGSVPASSPPRGAPTSS